MRERLAALDRALRTRIVGQAEVVEQVVEALLAGGHVLLEGVPGLGKTLLVKTLAQATGLGFGRVQFTPDLMPGDITGSQILDPQGGGLRFDPGPIFTNLLLADEINRATPRTQSALLEAMQERAVTVAGVSHPLPRPFFVLATQNPLEQEGTYPLPEAQLDRFFYKVLVPFPTEEELAEIALRTTGGEEPPVPRVLEAGDLLAAAELVRQVVVAPPVLQYAVRLVAATHPDRSPVEEVRRYARYGASPRGLQALVLGAKVRALRAGRWGVSFGDIEAVALPALRHRVAVNFEARAEGIGPEDLVRAVLAAVRPPVRA
ncbi:MAG: AAA family ATPase [Firmicutes bacterium]|nr:AAA family ATPase [Bacillota bacterium]